MTISAQETIQRLMRAFDVHDEATLAVRLGRDKHTLSVWKNRDMVPLLVLTEASKATGYSVEWLRGEAGAQPSASTRTPDDDATAVALSAREAELITAYRSTDEIGRRAVEQVTTTLARPKRNRQKGGDAPRLGSEDMAPAADVQVLVAREPEPTWLESHPVKGSTLRAGDVRDGMPAALLPIHSVSESRPLTLTVAGSAGQKVQFEVIPRYLEAASAAATTDAKRSKSTGLDLVGDMAFGLNWLRDNLGHTSGQLASIKVAGDSMAPTLIDGETIIIDTAVQSIDVGGIYVIGVRDVCLVKRIDPKLDGSLHIASDNKAYAPEKWPASRVREIVVKGRMVWPRVR